MNARFVNLRPGTEGQRINALRDRKEGSEVSTLELFYDVVYVFAVGQISYLLIDDLTIRGTIEATLLTMALWWAWIDTAWITNWFDPKKLPVRLMLITIMGLSLIMSVAIPDAFGGRSEWFAIAYVSIQVGRSAFCLYMLGNNVQVENFSRITAWALMSAPLWLIGGFVGGDAQFFYWGAALLIDGSAAAMGYRFPMLGASSTKHWTIAGGHMAERCQLVMILALGESVLLTGGALAAEKELTTPITFAFISAFAISVMMWWIYFSRSGKAAEIFEHSADPGGMGRAYTYFHLPMFGGIIAMAVANKKVVADPTGVVDPKFTAVAVGGACLYMFGNAVFNSRITDAFPKRRTITLLAIATVIPFAQFLSPVLVMYWILAPFVGLAVLDGMTAPPPYRDESGELHSGGEPMGEVEQNVALENS